MPKVGLPSNIAIDLLYQAGLLACQQGHKQLNVHVWHAQAHTILNQLTALTSHVMCQQNFKPESDKLKVLGIESTHDIDGLSDLALFFPHKNKQQSLYYMAKAMQSLTEGGRIIMACANVHGAKSYQHALASLAGHADGTSKAKCRIFSARKTPHFNHDLANQCLQAGNMQHVEALGLYSQAGLFSWNHEDAGSKLLLSQLPKLSGEGMDLCCGYGLLSVHILQHHADIQHLHLVDAEWQALMCAKKNTEKWHAQCHDHYLDATIDALPNHLDWVLCNPPFHAGQTRDLSLGQAIVAKGCQSLKHGGQLWMVANRQLPYEQVLSQHLREYQIIIEANGFKIIHGVR
ncbi:MAG: methyltransferase [Mariprofundaceae bacterium]|nr:methyltransferase [Mariprofundaceae bacterium]